MKNHCSKNAVCSKQAITKKQKLSETEQSELRNQGKNEISSDSKVPFDTDILSKIEAMTNLLFTKTISLEDEYSLDNTLSNGVKILIDLHNKCSNILLKC